MRVLNMKYNFFYYRITPVYDVFFTDSDPDFSGSDPEFWPIRIRILGRSGSGFFADPDLDSGKQV